MAQIALQPGNLYIVLGKKVERAFGLYAAIRAREGVVLCVARSHPDVLQRDFKIPPEAIIWLSNTRAPRSINPQNLGILTDTLVRTYEKGPGATTILEGVEYLMAQNDFMKVLKMINFIYEAVAVNQGIMIMTLDPEAFSAKEFAFLRRDGVTVEERDQMVV